MNTLSYAGYNETKKEEQNKNEEFSIQLGYSYLSDSDTTVTIGNWKG